jgi:hypothetical protein
MGFYVRRKTSGRSDKLFIGRYPDVSLEQARAKAMSFHADLAAGHNQVEEKRSLNCEIMLSGMGYDGLEGMKQTKSSEGRIILTRV